MVNGKNVTKKNVTKKKAVDVVIFKSGGGYRVHPGTVWVSLSTQHEVRFRNDTDRNVGVWLPGGAGPMPTVSLGTTKQNKTGPLSLVGVKAGHYDYVVYIAGENQFAEGNSAPHMIVDD